MTTRVAIWAAVSSRAQATEDKDSLASQVRDGRAWAEQTDARVTHTFEVPGHSRKLIFFRDAAAQMPAYGELRQACGQRAFDVLWCRARDRLGRTDALIAQVEALVAEAGAAVYSAHMPTPVAENHTASAIYMSAIERAQSEVETVQRIRRTRIGHKARVRNGLPHGGPPPYGLEYARNQRGESTRLVPNPAEAGAVRLIGQKYAAGWGVNTILRILNDSPYAPRRADRWPRTTVRQILKNPVYAGRVHYGDLVVASDAVEPLWDETTWRQIRRERLSRPTHGTDIATALSGLITCERCGHAMSHGEATYRYYRCSLHLQKSVTGRTCHPNTTHLDRLVEAVHGALTPLMRGDVGLDDLVAQTTPDLSHLQAERRQLVAELESIEEKRKRLAIALAEGTMAAAPYRAADDAILAELEQALASIRAIDARLATRPTHTDHQSTIKALREYWTEESSAWILQEENKHEINALLRRLNLRIYCDDKHVSRIAFVV